jgi:L-threonylcarbamoyladenylate synthase
MTNLNSQKNHVEDAISILNKGGVVIAPTETVYGIIADETKNSAVEKIYQIKERDNKKPLQILLPNIAEAQKYIKFNDKSLELAKKNWPGALTLILEAVDGHSIADNINSVDNSYGIRVPNSQIIQDILEKFGKPVAATSANISGDNAAVSIASLDKKIIDLADYIIDGGECSIGQSSTVIDYRDEENPKILRQGSVKLS